MKRNFKLVALSLALFAGSFGVSHAATILFPSGGGTGWGFPGGLKIHSVLIGNGLNPVGTTSPGTSGWVLTSNGASADPTFQAPSGGSGTVTQVNTTYPVLGGPFTTTGTISTALSTTTLKHTYGSAQGGDLTISSSTTAIGNDWGITNIAGIFTFNFPSATDTIRGLLSAADHAAFNAKQAAGNYLTALTGDATASGPGSAAITFATVNANVGSFTNANITVNGKGLITAAANGTGGGGGSGSVGTSTNEVANQVAVFSSNSATPATIGGSNNFIYNNSSRTLSVNAKTNIATTSSSALNVQDEFSTNIFTVGTASTTGNILDVASSTGDIYLSVTQANRVGVASSTPAGLFSVGSSTVPNIVEATTTVFASSASTKGTCLVMKDADGTGFSFITVNNGVLTASQTSCQ